MEQPRFVFFIIALICAFLIVGLELSANMVLGFVNQESPPGWGIRYLVLLDVTVLFLVLFFVLSFIKPIVAPLAVVRAFTSFLFFLGLLIGSIFAIIAAVLFLTMLVSLFLAIPFGTIAYIAGFGKFGIGAAQASLGVIMLLKVVLAVCLVLGYIPLLKVKMMVFLILCSILANVIVSFLHDIVPELLASITDAIAAIIVGILALIWALIQFIGSIPAVIKTFALIKETWTNRAISD